MVVYSCTFRLQEETRKPAPGNPVCIRFFDILQNYNKVKERKRSKNCNLNENFFSYLLLTWLRLLCNVIFPIQSPFKAK